MIPPDLVMVGETLLQYRIVARLGKGGMGEVYLADDTRLKRRVALKILPQETASDRERVERFQREAEALASLNHPNIVHIYSVEESGGLHFLVMEVVEGKSLDQLIPSAGFSTDELFQLAVPLAEALSAAHNGGITHRDLKPANLLVDGEGRIKVVDFGLAKLLQEEPSPESTQLPTQAITAEGRVLGTVPYMSPEQIEGKPVDARSDVFSLGIVLYEMATGRRPFEGDSSPSLMSAILKDRPPSAVDVNQRLPRHLGRIIQRCLEKNPEDRYPTGREVYIELKRLRAEVRAEQLLASSATRAPARGTRSARSSRWWLAAGLAVVVLAAVLWLPNLAKEAEEPPHAAASQEAPAGDRKMVVVLPFENIGDDPDRDFFADGMTEELITVLGRANPDRLGVIARTSAIHLKRTGATLDEIGRELGVGHVVEGSVRRQGNRIRIAATLIQVRDHTQLWSETIDATLDDIFALQNEVASRIARELSVELLPGTRATGTTYVPKSEAYDAYLSGRAWAQQATAEGWTRAIDFYEEAIGRDPGFALAHAGLADAAANSASWGVLPTPSAREKAIPAALEALRLEPGLAEAHAAFAVVNLFFEWDWAKAEAEFRRALELNPTDGESLHHFGHLLDFLGRQEEAIDACAEAVRLDPLSAFHRTCLAYSYISAGRWELAESNLQKVIELNPQLPIGTYTLGRAREIQGRFPEAVAAWEQAARLSGRRNRFILGALGHGYARVGQPERARAVLRELESNWADRNMTAMDRAKVLAGLGELDGAFELLEQAYATREPWIIGLKIDPGLEPLKGSPRYEALLRRLGVTL